MPTYGLRIKDASGTTILDVSDRITRLRYSNLVAAGASGNSGALADIDGLSSVEFGIGINRPGGGRAEHSVNRSGTTISWSPNSVEYYWSSMDSVVFLFLYT